MHGGDHATQYKEIWRQVKLEFKESKVNLTEWRKCHTTFEQARLRVVAYTPDEERSLILNQLPPPLVSDIVKEEHKRMDQHKWTVRVRKTEGLTKQTLVLILIRLWGLDHRSDRDIADVWDRIDEDLHGWIVRPGNERRKLHTLTVNGLNHMGNQLKV